MRLIDSIQYRKQPIEKQSKVAKIKYRLNERQLQTSDHRIA